MNINIIEEKNGQGMNMKEFDVLHMGRSCIDLYSNDIGTPFESITSFNAYVGGSPTNMCVGGRRLGLKSTLLTAVGEDPVGDFVLNYLKNEKVETRYISRKPGKRTSCVILGIEPPDRFPLVYYRENCADNELDIDDVLAAPMTAAKVFEFAGTNLSNDPSRSATIFAADLAKQNGATVILDLDFRPDQWKDPRYFGATLRSVLFNVDIILGTEDEINALMLHDISKMHVAHSQVSDARISGDTQKSIAKILSMGPSIVIEKIGKKGCRIHRIGERPIEVPGYPVEVQNILGAGDAFGAGFLYGYINGWNLYKAARLGNACGAIVVTRHACSFSMPTMEEVMAFVNQKGGLD
jgi:5-dehydro-2-deoxygluconokinase